MGLMIHVMNFSLRYSYISLNCTSYMQTKHVTYHSKEQCFLYYLKKERDSAIFIKSLQTINCTETLILSICQW